jgi:hypothetical protein
VAAQGARCVMAGQNFFGVNVCVTPDLPRYQLPKRLDLPCGVSIEFKPEFRREINAWAREFLGTTNLLRDGEMVMTQSGEAFVNPRTYAVFKAQVSGLTSAP